MSERPSPEKIPQVGRTAIGGYARFSITILVTVFAAGACGPKLKPLPPGEGLTEKERIDMIGRGSVWSAVDVKSFDFKLGPPGTKSFAPSELITCEYVHKVMNGKSPKFTCTTADGDELKVKYGERNPEVYGEVLATRLFAALGFPADHMYPVRVKCTGCSSDPWKLGPKPGGEEMFDPAAIEQKLPGQAIEIAEGSGWKWAELDIVAPDAPPDERIHRDALKLLGAFIQHGDSKPDNQRILCPKGQRVGRTGCRAPILMVHDLGLTFGKADLFDKSKNSVSFADWSKVPVWKDRDKCIAEIKGPFFGGLANPRISEAGRAFLADLLNQISDDQLRDLFETARIEVRSSDPSANPAKDKPPVSVDEWIKLFRSKRAQITEHSCKPAE
ncbi:MAG: hypothetical protein ABIR28_13595 [Vicinamibacteria bacterium]